MNFQIDTMNMLSNLNPDDLKNFVNLLSLISQRKRTQPKTIGDFSNEYSKYSNDNFSPKYMRSIGLSFSHLISYFSAERLLTDIKTKDIEQFEANLRCQAPKGYMVYHRNLKAAFNKAKDWEYIDENPFVKVRLPKQQEINPDYLTEADLRVIVSKTNSKTLRDLFKFAFYTGCRLSEIVNLRWTNVDLQRRIITIGDMDFTTKSRKQRSVPICNELFSILNNLNSRTVNPVYVFGKQNGFPFTAEYVSKKFKAVCREAGMREAVHFHTLRHSFSSNLVQKGVSIITLKELLGHSSVSVTERYSHICMETLKDAINVFNTVA